MAKLEELALEIESIHDRTDELKPLAQHSRDDAYPRDQMIQDLLDARLGFFAHKLVTGYYDKNAEAFAKQQIQAAADQQAAAMVKEQAKKAEEQPAASVAGQPADNPELCPECKARLDSELHDMHVNPQNHVKKEEGTESAEQSDVPQASDAGGDVENKDVAQHPVSHVTTTDTMQFPPDDPNAPKDPAVSAEVVSAVPAAPAAALPDCAACIGVHLTPSNQHPK